MYLSPVTNILSHIIINYCKMGGHCFHHFHWKVLCKSFLEAALKHFEAKLAVYSNIISTMSFDKNKQITIHS